MNTREYKDKIVALLRRSDIVSAGTLLESAAECILYCSESGECIDEFMMLEEAAGIDQDYEDLST